MGIAVEFNPDLALRNSREFQAGRREEAECIPEPLVPGQTYDFLKNGQRNYWLLGELPLVETKGNCVLSKPLASIVILEATHFNRDDAVMTRGRYRVVEVFTDNQIHFNGFAKVQSLKIGIVGSMQYTERMLELRDRLQAIGHTAFMTDLHDSFLGKSDAEKEQVKIEQKMNQDAIRAFWRQMQGADAMLVANYDKHGITNYIGGNTLMEIGFAHVLNQKIFLLNPIPNIPYYQSEIEAVRPIVINGDLSLIS